MTQAKVHLVHHLTRQVKRLTSKKGTEEQKRKNERKAHRFKEELSNIKLANKDEVARFAVTNKKKLDQVRSSAITVLAV